MYGVDLGFSGDFGAVTQADSTLLLLVNHAFDNSLLMYNLHILFVCCRPVCEMYGTDLGFSGDFGVVMQANSTLLLLGDHDESCIRLSAATTDGSEARPCSDLHITFFACCRPVCAMYGADLGFGGDFGAVTQATTKLLLLGKHQNLTISCCCRPVCAMYGADLGFSGDFGAVTQANSTLLLLGCSAPIVELTPSCILANASNSEPHAVIACLRPC